MSLLIWLPRSQFLEKSRIFRSSKAWLVPAGGVLYVFVDRDGLVLETLGIGRRAPQASGIDVSCAHVITRPAPPITPCRRTGAQAHPRHLCHLQMRVHSGCKFGWSRHLQGLRVGRLWCCGRRTCQVISVESGLVGCLFSGRATETHQSRFPMVGTANLLLPILHYRGLV